MNRAGAIVGALFGIGIGLLTVFGLQWAQVQLSDMVQYSSSPVASESTRPDWTNAYVIDALLCGVAGLLLGARFESR